VFRVFRSLKNFMKPDVSNVPPAALGHLAITASAGAGKTYQLAHRYLRLLAAGVPPERIAALTFSRKAAGEIFDKIVGYLVDYTAEPALGSARLGATQPLTAADFTALLRRLLEALPRLRIGTLDSFTVSLAGAFPLELGISPDLQLMDNDGGAAAEAVRETLDALFAAQTLDPRAQDEFVDLFKQATFGLEEKNIEQALRALLDRGRAAWLAAPDPARWGAADRIWGAPPAWLARPPAGAHVAAAAAQLRASLGQTKLGHKSALAGWEKLIAQARDFRPRSPSDAADDFLNKIGPAAEQLAAGQAVIKVYKELALTPAQCGDLRLLLEHVLAIALQRALTSTQGAGRFLALFERFYDERIRRRGRLTFGDLQALLAPGNAFNGGVTLSRRRAAAARLYIDYRLDGRLDHWLLDEFQDTSDQQWRVLENLADEILQDNSGARTFFLVGDVKQSIYGWRAGNPELFGRILAQYPNIAREHLAASRRSGPAVISAVNRVFRGFDQVPDMPAAVGRRWADLWHEHTCAGAAGTLPGQAVLLDLPATADGKPEAEDRRRVLTALLRELDPVARGWSAAVLVRTNAQVKAICQHLRRHAPGLPVANEGVAAILDNPAVNVLIALTRWAAHPGDTRAAQHLRMSPLAAHSSLSSPAPLLREIQEDGFQRFFRHWRAALEQAQPLHAHEQRRLDELLIAAGAFDDTRAREVDAFLRYIEAYQTHEPTAEAAVRVMTIHQAKGLEFDMVFLPELQDPLANDTSDLLQHRAAATGRTDWVLLAPRKAVLQSEARLAAEADIERARGLLENICVLYVAMTRAKRGLYLITSYPGKSSASLTAASLLKQQLCGDPKPDSGPEWTLGADRVLCLYETGARDWHQEGRTKGEGPSEAMRPAPEWTRLAGRSPSKGQPDTESGGRAAREPSGSVPAPPARRRLIRVEPARGAPVESAAGAEADRRLDWLFHPENRATLEFGSAIHELLRAVEWAEAADVEGIIRAFHARSAAAADVRRDAAAQFRQALADPEVRRALARPAGRAELWREQAFEAVLGDQWISGAFDRVVIQRDDAGQAQAAVILDFKSHRVAAAGLQAKAEDCRAQLEWYRRALALLLRLPPDRIRLQILFTRPGQVVELEAERI